MEVYIVSIISALLGFVSSRFANRKSNGILPTIGVLSILAFTAVGLTFLGHWIVKPPRDRLEGQWIEKYDEEGKTIYAIATIKYNSEAKYLEFKGDAYDSSLRNVGYWNTTIARLDGNHYLYLFNGASKNPDPTIRGEEDRKGIGDINFVDNHNLGQGTFTSVRAKRDPKDFELYKIIDEATQSESINSPKEFIQKLYTDPAYLKQVTSPH